VTRAVTHGSDSVGALLPGDEGEPCPEFEQERLDLAQNGGFEVGFRVGVF